MSYKEVEEWLHLPEIEFLAEIKRKKFLTAMIEMTEWHRCHCAEYRSILNALHYGESDITSIAQLPAVPARLFKEYDLASVAKEKIFKTLTSSGTSGQVPSKIYLDRETATFQTKVLSRLMRNVIGAKRQPMLIIDTPSILKDRNKFSARAAGVLGFSMFGTDVTYALTDNMELDVVSIESFLTRNADKNVFIFGFTFMIWQYFVKQLRENNILFDFSKATLIHGGGWKKLTDEMVSNAQFKGELSEVCMLNRVINYYGMVEQTGSLFFECEEGNFHTSFFSDVMTRRSEDLQPAEFGERGILQVLSVIPRSYPGHVILTEDEGTLIGEDDCPCGHIGKYFQVHGRLKLAEVRGCGDTHDRRS